MSPDNDQSLLTVVAGTYLCLHIRCPRGKTLNPPPQPPGIPFPGGIVTSAILTYGSVCHGPDILATPLPCRALQSDCGAA